MGYINTVFNQLLKVLPRHCFQKAVDRHRGDKGTRTLSCRAQFHAMLFAQLTSRQSRRDPEDNFNLQRQRHIWHFQC